MLSEIKDAQVIKCLKCDASFLAGANMQTVTLKEGSPYDVRDPVEVKQILNQQRLAMMKRGYD